MSKREIDFCQEEIGGTGENNGIKEVAESRRCALNIGIFKSMSVDPNISNSLILTLLRKYL
jgi:hypothetical protein